MGDDVIDLPTGLDTNLFKPGVSSVRRKLGWKDSDFVVGYVGRFTRLKGVDILARSFRELFEQSSDLRLLLVGHGEEEQKLRSDLAEENKVGSVHFTGGVPQIHLPEWYRAMDLLVMPSRYENFSNAILEGMACGIPFLASDVGGNRIYANSGSGWLFEAGSAEALSGKIREIMANPGDRRERGRLSLKVAQGYSWELQAFHLEKILRKKFSNGCS